MPLDSIKRLVRGLRPGKQPAAPHWRTPAILDRGSLGEARLALNGRGHGLALWENDGCLWSMPIGPRSSPALMRLPMGEGNTPRIVLIPDGRGIALWQAEAAGERQLLGKILGGGDAMARVIFRTSGAITHLQAAVDRRGNALVAWLHETEGRFEVNAQSFDTRDQAWEKEPTTLGLPLPEAVKPHIAVNDREHAMVLWDIREEGFEGLVASHYWPTDRIWSDRTVPVVSHATRDHQVVMDDLGNALAIWIHAVYGQESVLEASFYDVHHSEWDEPQVLGSGSSLMAPRLVMSGRGEALAAWCQGDGASRLYSKSFTRGKWNPEVVCLDPGQGTVRDFALALGNEGQAGVLTVQEGGAGFWPVVRLRKGEWSTPVALAQASRMPCSAPRLMLCPHGASALWIVGEGRDKVLVLSETN